MTDVWNGIAGEFLHLYPRGNRLLAVSGADAERSRRAADDLARALRSAGQTVERVHSDTGDATDVRTEIVSPFRESAEDGRVLIVSGPAALMSEAARGIWNCPLNTWCRANCKRSASHPPSVTTSFTPACSKVRNDSM